MSDWLKNATANFVGSLFAGLIVLYVSAVFVNKATGFEKTKNLPEPLKSTLQGVHQVSSDIVYVFLKRDELKTKGIPGDSLNSEKLPQRSIVGGDVAYVAAQKK